VLDAGQRVGTDPTTANKEMWWAGTRSGSRSPPGGIAGAISENGETPNQVCAEARRSGICQVAVDHSVHVQNVALLTTVEAESLTSARLHADLHVLHVGVVLVW